MSANRFYATARRVCTAEEIEVIELRGVDGSGGSWSEVCRELWLRHGEWPTRAAVRHRFEKAYGKVMTAMSEEGGDADDS